MWNYGTNSVTIKGKGPDVITSTFGGEGTGQKSKKFLSWRVGQWIQFTVKGTYLPSIDGWRVEA